MRWPAGHEAWCGSVDGRRSHAGEPDRIYVADSRSGCPNRCGGVQQFHRPPDGSELRLASRRQMADGKPDPVDAVRARQGSAGALVQAPGMIVLSTDFGLQGPYTGQMKAVLQQMATGIPAIDLFADAPVGNPKASSYLLAV